VKATVALIVWKCAEHCADCKKWGGKLTKLRSQIATQLQALANYLRPAEMQELLRKGDSCSLRKLAAISKERGNAARAQLATTAGELLADCQALEYDPHPGHTSKQHVPRIDSAMTEIGAIGSALIGISSCCSHHNDIQRHAGTHKTPVEIMCVQCERETFDIGLRLIFKGYFRKSGTRHRALR
jgi:hypothetical protein